MNKPDRTPDYTIAINRLPNFQDIGGNRRHFNAWAEYRAFKLDKRRWVDQLTLDGYRSNGIGSVPYLAGAIGYTVTFFIASEHELARHKRRDEDNAQAALKTLLDVLETPRIIGATNVRGWLGVYDNDNQLERIDSIRYEHNPNVAALSMTTLRFWELDQ